MIAREAGDSSFAIAFFACPFPYACDRIEIHWSLQVPLHLQRQHIFFVKCSYPGRNDRSFGSQGVGWQKQGLPPVQRTSTTPTLPTGMLWFSWGEFEDTLPPELLALESDIGKFATRVEFFWQMMVHLSLPWKQRWVRHGCCLLLIGRRCAFEQAYQLNPGSGRSGRPNPLDVAYITAQHIFVM